MILTILRNSTYAQRQEAHHYTADHLHIPLGEVTDLVAVAYVDAHFQQGQYQGWDGFTDMLKADQR